MRILVLDGGGQLGTFEWGAMCELARQGIKYDYFDEYVCTSAGTFNAAYFLTEQYEEGKKIWLKHLPKKFWKPFKNDMDALKDILSRIEPLNCGVIQHRNQKIYINLSNFHTGQADYICLNDEPNIIEALLAGCSMPFLADPRKLRNNLYYDGGLTGQPQLSKAISLFPDAEIWVIMTRPLGFRLNKTLWETLSFLIPFNSKLKRLVANYPANQNYQMKLLEKNPNFKIISPKSALPINYRSRNLKLIKEVFDFGQVAASKFLETNYRK